MSGPTESVINQETTVTNLTVAGNSNCLFDYTQDDLVDTLKQLWETESIGIKEVSEIMVSHDGFNEQIRFNGQRYEVPLPWRDNIQQYRVTMNCVNRVKSLQRKLLKEPELIREYNQIIEEQLSKGVMEKVAAEDNEKENVHYLSHHAVIRRDRETTKLRIVYDGSAKPPERTHSLNDCLETGPNYTDLQLRLAVPPKTQSLKYWAQFGTLIPTSSRSIWQISRNTQVYSRLRSDRY